MIHFRRTILLAVLTVLGATIVHSQSNQVVDVLLAQKEATGAEVAYMALVGGGLLAETATPQEALDQAAQKGWLPKGLAPEAALSLEDFSVLAMRSFNLKGGIGWMVFGSKRYAYRELVALGIANGSGGPKRIPSGEEALRMIGMAASSDRRKK